MNKQSLIPALVVCVLLLLGGNVLMARWSRRLPYCQKLESIRLARDPDVLFVGNSLLDSRIDAAALNMGGALRGVSFTPLNAALGGSDAYDQALIARYATQCHPGIHTLVIGFFDFQLTDERQVKPLDLTGNHMVAMDGRFPVSEVASIYHFNAVEAAELRMLRAVPMAANRASVWKYVELMRRSMGDVGMPHQAKNSMGRAADFAALEADSPESFDRRAEVFRRDSSHFNASYEHIFAKAEQAQMQIVLVVMPMSPDHRSRFYARPAWKEYLGRLQELARQRGFSVIDAEDWMPDADEFADALHMTMPAASRFSSRVGVELAQLSR
jgi:hypothetical protein